MSEPALGGEVNTSLLANGLWAASCLAQAKFVGADFSGWRKPGRIGVTRPVYRAADGRWLQFTMVRTPLEIAALFHTLGLADLLAEARFATPESRLDNGVELVGHVRAAIALRESQHWLTKFHDAKVPAALVGTLDDLLTDPQLAANGMTAIADAASVGAARVINHPINVVGLPRRAVGAAPALGQHSGEILGRLGYTSTDIAELRSDGVV